MPQVSWLAERRIRMMGRFVFGQTLQNGGLVLPVTNLAVVVAERSR